MRKIIQIIVDMKGKLMALCDDGTIWVKNDAWMEMSQEGMHDDEDGYGNR